MMKVESLLGVSEIDNQHKELMNFFNETVANCSSNETENRKYFDKTIDTFINLLSKHFDTEEMFLSGKDYALYEEHKLEHIKLLEKIRFITSEIQNNKWDMNLLILTTTLKNWLMYHLETYDTSAKEYFTEETGIEAARESA